MRKGKVFSSEWKARFAQTFFLGTHADQIKRAHTTPSTYQTKMERHRIAKDGKKITKGQRGTANESKRVHKEHKNIPQSSTRHEQKCPKRRKVFAESLGMDHLLKLSSEIAQVQSTKLQGRVDRVRDKQAWQKEKNQKRNLKQYCSNLQETASEQDAVPGIADQQRSQAMLVSV